MKKKIKSGSKGNKKYKYTTTTTTTENFVISRKAGKFLGYCKCGGSIGDIDLISKRKYECPACCESGKVNMLQKEKELKKYLNKRDYLEDTVNVDIIDMVVNSDFNNNDKTETEE